MRFRTLLILALASAATVSGLAPSTPSPKTAASVLPWIDDDYARALSEAKRKKIPIFAELWAPWCHTCRSMQAFVFTDKALSRNAGQFIWLSIDTEKEQNAPFVKKFPNRAWPSYYVIDPNTETVSLRWVGGATVAQLRKFFHDGSRAAGGTADAALGKADALYSAGDYEKAQLAYAEALAGLSPKSPAYSRAVEARLYSLQTTRNYAECVAFARATLPSLAHTVSGATFAGAGLDCAGKLPSTAAGRSEAIAFFEAKVRAALADASLKLVADDRSALYGSLQSALDDGGDKAGAQKVADEWVAYHRRRSGAREDGHPAHRPGPQPVERLRGGRPGRKGHPDARGFRKGVPRGLQPAGAAGPGLPVAQAVRRGARGLRPRSRARVRAAQAARARGPRGHL